MKLFGIQLCLALFLLGNVSLGWAKHVVVLLSRSIPPFEEAWKGLSSDSSIQFVKKNMSGDSSKGKEIMMNLTPDTCDAVITIGSAATHAAKSLDPAIPIIFTMIVTEPVMPDRICTGVLLTVEIKKQLEVINKVFPSNSIINVVYNTYYSGDAINEAREVTKTLGKTFMPIIVRDQSDIEQALNKFNVENSVLWSIADPTVGNPKAIELMISYALENRVPFFGFSQNHVKAGAFAALTSEYQSIGAQTAELAQKTIASMKKLPVEYPAHLDLHINSATMKKIKVSTLPVFEKIKVIAD